MLRILEDPRLLDQEQRLVPDLGRSVAVTVTLVIPSEIGEAGHREVGSRPRLHLPRQDLQAGCSSERSLIHALDLEHGVGLASAMAISDGGSVRVLAARRRERSRDYRERTRAPWAPRVSRGQQRGSRSPRRSSDDQVVAPADVSRADEDLVARWWRPVRRIIVVAPRPDVGRCAPPDPVTPRRRGRFWRSRNRGRCGWCTCARAGLARAARRPRRSCRLRSEDSPHARRPGLPASACAFS